MDKKAIKVKINEIHKNWKILGDSVDGYKYGGIHESYVIQLIAEYCIIQTYDVEGFPIQKRIDEIINGTYDEAYFCHERYAKYLDVLATQYEDVFDLMYFYSSTFWPKQFYSQKRYKEVLLDYISEDVYELDF